MGAKRGRSGAPVVSLTLTGAGNLPEGNNECPRDRADSRSAREMASFDSLISGNIKRPGARFGIIAAPQRSRA
jgi:hypothetical protein